MSDLPTWDQIDSLVEGDPLALRDLAWRLRNEVARLNVELVEGPLPVLLGWETAPFDEECHWCRNGIDEDGRVAVLSTAARICEPCASGQRRGDR